MLWQDVAISFGTLILAISLIPTLLNRKARIPLWSSLPIALVLFPFFAFVFWTLGTFFSAAGVGVQGGLWWFIVFYRRLETKHLHRYDLRDAFWASRRNCACGAYFDLSAGIPEDEQIEMAERLQ